MHTSCRVYHIHDRVMKYLDCLMYGLVFLSGASYTTVFMIIILVHKIYLLYKLFTLTTGVFTLVLIRVT